MFDPIIRFVLMTLSGNTKRDETGATAVEYGLLVALVAGAIIVTVGLLGLRLNVAFNDIYKALPVN